jgi:hypothetical protein
LEKEDRKELGREVKSTAMMIPACPRCGKTNTELLAKSPVPDVWEMYGCKTCTYLWRNIEPLEGIRTITEEEIEAAVLDFPPPTGTRQL